MALSFREQLTRFYHKESSSPHPAIVPIEGAVLFELVSPTIFTLIGGACVPSVITVFNKMRVAIKKTDHATRCLWTPGKYDVVCSAHNDISRTSASQCLDYYVRCLPVLIE